MKSKFVPIQVSLKPIEGCYQEPKPATIVRDTPTLWIVVRDDRGYEEKYSKETLLKIGSGKNDFPKRVIEFA